jgi:hypothetical protein
LWLLRLWLLLLRCCIALWPLLLLLSCWLIRCCWGQCGCSIAGDQYWLWFVCCV